MTCAVERCEERVHARGWCATHYSRWRAHGDATFTKFHRQYKTPEYGAWLQARARCRNPSHPGFRDYGGRGIKFCERWDKFENFSADMGERPDGGTLERNNVNGDYDPGNCRWATQSEQNHNRRPMSSTGVRGVTVTGYTNLGFRAQIKRGGIQKQKCFATIAEASNWYERMSKELY